MVRNSSRVDDSAIDAEAALSDRQRQILNFVREHVYSRGYPPAVREIGQAVGLSSSASDHSHLQKLEKIGQRIVLSSYCPVAIVAWGGATAR